MWIDDLIMNNCEASLACSVWVPDAPVVVLGSANNSERETYYEQCAAQKIPVLKRYGGGGTVVLYDGCVVVSLGTWVDHPFHNDRYFRLLNNCCIAATQEMFPEYRDFGQMGLSDLTLGSRKWGGTSMFRSRHYLLYQASLIFHLNIPLIDELLPHPSKEPDYRQGKSHRDFLVGVSEGQSDGQTTRVLAETFRAYFLNHLRTQLRSHLVDPDPKVTSHLRQRARRGVEHERDPQPQAQRLLEGLSVFYTPRLGT